MQIVLQILFALFASLIVEFMSGYAAHSFYVNLRLLLSCTHGKDKGQRTQDNDNAYVGLLRADTDLCVCVRVSVVCCFNFV